ncbi:hypothetical protein Tco_1105395 [Tanacetum coccineum]
MGISVNSQPIKSGIKDFFSGVVGTMMSPGGSIMASREDINDFLAENPPEKSRFSILLGKNIFESRVCNVFEHLKLEEVWFTICDENEILNTFESSNDITNVVNVPQEPFVFNQDPGENSSQSPPHIDHHCCYGCGDSLDGIFCQQCTCESCGNGAHYGYNCPPQAPIISNPEPCNNQTVDELPQTLPSFNPTCYSGDGSSFTYDSTPNFVDDSPNVFNPPSQPPTYSCEFCGNDAHYGYDCPP